MRYIIGDTETTGLGPTWQNPDALPKKLCDVALIEIDPHTLEIIGDLQSLIDPEIPIEAGAAEIHGISDEMVQDAPTLDEYIESVLGGQLEGDITLIGYKTAFDAPLLRPFGRIVKEFDVLPLAQMMVEGTENHKLQTMREHFKLPGGEAHRAMGDCLTLHQLLKVLIPASGRSLLQHCATEYQLYSKMPWGKHQGTPIITLPQHYKRWLLTLPDLDVNLRKSIEFYHNTDKRIL